MTLNEFQQQASVWQHSTTPLTRLHQRASSEALMQPPDMANREAVALSLGQALVAIADLATEYRINLTVAAYRGLDAR